MACANLQEKPLISLLQHGQNVNDTSQEGDRRTDVEYIYDRLVRGPRLLGFLPYRLSLVPRSRLFQQPVQHQRRRGGETREVRHHRVLRVKLTRRISSYPAFFFPLFFPWVWRRCPKSVMKCLRRQAVTSVRSQLCSTGRSRNFVRPTMKSIVEKASGAPVCVCMSAP